MLKFAQNITLKAGKLLVQMQSAAQVAKHKDDFGDIATTADLASEQLIISAIEAKYPSHNIFSEEIGLIDHHSEYTWYVDPLDGTKEYARGLYRYAVLISCQTATKIIVSSVYFPVVNLLYSSSLDQGGYLGNTKLHVSSQAQLSHAYIFSRLPGNYVTEPDFSASWAINKQLAKIAYKLRPCSFEAEVLCWVAQGAADAMIVLGDYGPKWWDVAAGLSIAAAAGATITNRYGKPLKMGVTNEGIVVSNGKLHQELLDIINA